MTAFWIAVVAGVLLVAVTVLMWENRKLYVYRSTHPYSDADVTKLRALSVQQSKATRGGHVGEQMYPLLPDFFEKFNLKDARFIGQPIDYIIFDGLDEEHPDVTVFLVEVKTGQSRLSKREQVVRDAVNAGRVEWLEVRLTEPPPIDWSTITVTDIDPDTVWNDDDE